MTSNEITYRTGGGVEITRAETLLPMDGALEHALTSIERRRGAVFASGYEYPGRYSRWDIAFVDPPAEIVSQGRDFVIRALNDRGRVILRIFAPALEGLGHLESFETSESELRGRVKPMPGHFLEEDRSKQPSIFSVLRALTKLMHSDEDSNLGFAGAMGYDLVFQFEPIRLRHERTADRPDLHLFIPDELFIVDRRKEQAHRFSYDFAQGEHSTRGLARETETTEPPSPVRLELKNDHAEGEYARKVEIIREGCKRGDFFEVVLSQVLTAGFAGTSRELFEMIRTRNPSPYEFLINLGPDRLVGASPEMFVRVDSARVETCPISGTVRRGDTPIEDAEAILSLLNSEKDRAELTMCTDVDRNDKSRVCKPGSVKVLGRRMIEIYSKLIHTVDHVEGELRDDCDGFDALLSHMWACTLTGSPKPAAMQEIEDLENSARGWYGGCVGMLAFNGDISTGITIRTVHLEDGLAHVRVGATLLVDSDPDEEQLETQTKAEAFIGAVLEAGKPVVPKPEPVPEKTGAGKKILFVDHYDSFVHTLANYVRQTGAEVITVRTGFSLELIDEIAPDLVFVSPGPGTPSEFGVADLVKACVQRGLPVFGVCLGLQGMVEAFGGRIDQLDYPMHGKSSTIKCEPGGIFVGFPTEFTAGRYHSLYAAPDRMPDCLRVRARTEDGVIMAVEHETYPAAAVQFHPESILTLKDGLGFRLLSQAIDHLTRPEARAAAKQGAS